MISGADAKKIVASAHRVLRLVEDDPRELLCEKLPGKVGRVVRFAQLVTAREFGLSVNVFSVQKLPRRGYFSWLVVAKPGVPEAIAIDTGRVNDLRRGDGQEIPATSVMRSRLVLHELGHIFATPELLQQPTITHLGYEYAVPATPEQEEIAWVWVYCLLGIALGDLALARASRLIPCDDVVKMTM
jgi:hypothetical protein